MPTTTTVTVNINRRSLDAALRRTGDDWSPEAREAAAKARAAHSHGGTVENKTKVSKSALKTKLEGMPHAKLMAALKNPDVDPKVKKEIEKELDDRGERGTMKGHGEK